VRQCESQKSSKVGGDVVKVLVKMAPDLFGAGAEQKEVIRIFIKRAGEAGGRAV
jgi:hypothetical protein